MTYFHRITDWDDAYANRIHIPDADAYIERWEQQSKQHRQQHANSQLNVAYLADAPQDDDNACSRLIYDVFEPNDQPSKGLLVFVHGGYWVAFSKDTWSCFAKGALAAGYTVVVPSYPLCPTASISHITECLAACVNHAADSIDGPIVLKGHSAGGHLVTSLVSYDEKVGDYSASGLLSDKVINRIQHVVSISGVHDLRPLLKTKLNEQLKLNIHTAAKCSPVLSTPLDTFPITAWVGGSERNEFIRQSELLVSMWQGMGGQAAVVIEPDRHHFNVIDGLKQSDSALMQHVLGRDSFTVK